MDTIFKNMNKNEIKTILEIGSPNFEKSKELYDVFPNAEIRIEETDENLKERIKENFKDRMLEKEVDIYDLCYLHEMDVENIDKYITKSNIISTDESVIYNKNKKQIVLISTGIFQEYLLINIEHLLKLEHNVHMITEKDFFPHLDKYKKLICIYDTSKINIDSFNKNSRLDKNFRNGFWENTSKRIFYLYEFMKLYNIKNVLHIENDVLLYNKMEYNMENKIYLVMDSVNRCIPSIMYIPDYRHLTKLIEKYIFDKNDMVNLANFYNKNRENILTFPIINDGKAKSMYNENYDTFQSIFDGAAIGQLLGGVDPRNISGNTIGFVNETCEIKYNNYEFKWVLNKDNIKVPFVNIDNKWILINNLHIHSKNLKSFV